MDPTKTFTRTFNDVSLPSSFSRDSAFVDSVEERQKRRVGFLSPALKYAGALRNGYEFGENRLIT